MPATHSNITGSLPWFIESTVVAFAALWALWPALFLTQLVYDDTNVAANGVVTGDVPLLRGLVERDFWGAPLADPGSHRSWRPLAVLSLRATQWASQNGWLGMQGDAEHDTQAVAQVAQLHRMVTVGLHVATSELVLCLCLAAVRRPQRSASRWGRTAALLSALLFAVHPIHTESICSIAGRADVLAGLFFAAALVVYVRSWDRPHAMLSVAETAAVLGLACASVLSKEQGVACFGVLLCCDFASLTKWLGSRVGPHCGTDDCARHSGSRHAPRVVPRPTATLFRIALTASALSVVVACRLAVMQWGIPQFARHQNPAAANPSLAVRSLTFWHVFAKHYSLLVWPWPLSYDWSMDAVPLVQSVFDVRNTVTVSVCGCLVSLCAWIIMPFVSHVPHGVDGMSRRRMGPVLGFATLILPHVLASNALVTVGFVVGERVMYAQSVGLSLLLACHGQQWADKDKHVMRKTAAAACAIAVVIGAGWLAARRCSDWRSQESLVRAASVAVPTNAKAHYDLGVVLFNHGDTNGASWYYESAARLFPGYTDPVFALGNLALDGGRNAAAAAHFRHVVSLADMQYCVSDSGKAVMFGASYLRLSRLSRNDTLRARQYMDMAAAYLAQDIPLLRNIALRLVGVGDAVSATPLLEEYVLRYRSDCAVARALADATAGDSDKWTLYAAGVCAAA